MNTLCEQPVDLIPHLAELFLELDTADEIL